jgi:hypothetical protein
MPSTNPVITINQGRSGNSPYFLAAESPRTAKAMIHDEVQCIHPRTKHLTKGRVIDLWTFPWDEPIRGVILLGYGVEPGLLMAGLRAIDPAFEDDWVTILLILEIK